MAESLPVSDCGFATTCWGRDEYGPVQDASDLDGVTISMGVFTFEKTDAGFDCI
jgi:hypothetical protein